MTLFTGSCDHFIEYSSTNINAMYTLFRQLTTPG